MACSNNNIKGGTRKSPTENGVWYTTRRRAPVQKSTTASTNRRSSTNHRWQNSDSDSDSDRKPPARKSPKEVDEDLWYESDSNHNIKRPTVKKRQPPAIKKRQRPAVKKRQPLAVKKPPVSMTNDEGWLQSSYRSF
jgi:hypothetical protein